MAAKSSYLNDIILNLVLTNTSYTQPTLVYVGLFTSDGGLADNNIPTQTEISGGSYSREAITFGPAGSGTISNIGTVTFSTATADWGTITHVGIMDASSAGNVLYWSALDSSIVINTNGIFTVDPGDFDITES